MQKFSQIDEFITDMQGNWGKLKEALLGIINKDVSKKEIAPRNPCITQEIINKMEERRKVKNYRLQKIFKI